MANRWFCQFRYSLEKNPVDLFVKVSFGASGAATLSTANSKGITSFTKNGTGTYDIVLQDKYYKLLNVTGVFSNGATGPAAPVISVKTNSVTSAALTVLFQAGGTNTDPASGEVLYLAITLSNSGAL